MSTPRKHRPHAWSLLLIALLFLALVMAGNTLLRNFRWDLTENRLYTMSDGTRNILAQLEEPLNLYFFFSEQTSRDLPSVRNYANRVREMLEEFSAVAGGKIQLKVIDPLPFSEEEDRAAEFGLTPVPIGTAGENIYFGLAATNSVDDAATIAFFHPDKEHFLEYDLAKMVQSLQAADRPLVGLLSGLPMHRDFDPLSAQLRQAWVVSDQAEQLFDITRLDSQLERIEPEVDVLWLVHPRNLAEKTLYAIDQFILGGGRALIFVDPFAESESQQALPGAQPPAPASRSSNLGPLFGAWGVRYNPGEVLADEELALGVTLGPGRGSVRHLAYLGFGRGQLSGEDVVTAQLDSINAASTGFFDLDPASPLRMTPLLQSTDKAMPVTADRFSFLPDPAALRNGFEPTARHYTVAARLTGTLATAFPGGLAGSDLPHRETSEGEATIILVADTDLLTDPFWVQVQDFLGNRLATPFAGNGDLVVNALDNLSGSQDLISIRGRAGYTRPFTRVEALRREAEASLLAKQSELEQQLKATEESLSRLQTQRPDDDALLLTGEQSLQLQRFLEDKRRIRGELRQVRLELDQDINRLGNRLKLINIGLVPLLLILALVLWIAWPGRRK